jgi:hypothetical protein
MACDNSILPAKCADSGRRIEFMHPTGLVVLVNEAAERVPPVDLSLTVPK